MRLVVVGDDRKDLSPFINTTLSRLMRLYIKSHLDTRRLDRYEIEQENFIKTINSVNYIRCRKIGSTYIVDINPNLNIVNSFAKLDDVCRLINYGSIDKPAYPIFTQMFNYMQKEFYVLYKYSTRR